MTRLVCVFALITTAAACGGVSLDDLKNQEVDAICDRLVRCGAIANKQVCVDAYDRLFNDAQLKAGVGNGSITYDDGKAGDCIDALRGESCDSTAMDKRVEPQACKDAVKGTRKQGDPCYFDTQCTSDSCAPPTGQCTMACCAGTCDADPPAAVAIGQSCQTALCVDGAYCDATSTCAALLAEGQPCNGNNQCGYDLVCAGSTTATCVKTPKVGDACLANGGPTGTICDVTGLRCDATTQKCVALLDKGATCDPQVGGCKQDLVCDATAHTCNPPPGDGQACTGFCAPPDHCAIDQNTGQGTCTAPLANGMQCQSSSECASNFCDQSQQPAVCADQTVCS